jgi:hypothetical protein
MERFVERLRGVVPADRVRRVNTSQGGRTNVRWLMVFLAFLATSINYIDRANLGPADMGLILPALVAIPGGWIGGS